MSSKPPVGKGPSLPPPGDRRPRRSSSFRRVNGRFVSVDSSPTNSERRTSALAKLFCRVSPESVVGSPRQRAQSLSPHRVSRGGGGKARVKSASVAQRTFTPIRDYSRSTALRYSSSRTSPPLAEGTLSHKQEMKFMHQLRGSTQKASQTLKNFIELAGSIKDPEVQGLVAECRGLASQLSSTSQLPTQYKLDELAAKIEALPSELHATSAAVTDSRAFKSTQKLLSSLHKELKAIPRSQPKPKPPEDLGSGSGSSESTESERSTRSTTSTSTASGSSRLTLGASRMSSYSRSRSPDSSTFGSSTSSRGEASSTSALTALDQKIIKRSVPKIADKALEKLTAFSNWAKEQTNPEIVALAESFSQLGAILKESKSHPTPFLMVQLQYAQARISQELSTHVAGLPVEGQVLLHQLNTAMSPMLGGLTLEGAFSREVPFASGGTASIYSVPNHRDQVIKVFRADASDEDVANLIGENGQRVAERLKGLDHPNLMRTLDIYYSIAGSVPAEEEDRVGGGIGGGDPSASRGAASAQLRPEGVLMARESGTALFDSKEGWAHGIRNNPTRMWSISKQVGDGLAHMHGNDLVHRDVQLKNIMVDVDNDSVHATVGDLDSAYLPGSSVPKNRRYMFPPEMRPTPAEELDYAKHEQEAYEAAKAEGRRTPQETVPFPEGTLTQKFDSWQLGIVIAELFFNDKPCETLSRGGRVETLSSLFFQNEQTQRQFGNLGNYLCHEFGVNEQEPIRGVLHGLLATDPDERTAVSDVAFPEV